MPLLLLLTSPAAPQDIEEFEAKYTGSEMETEDLCEAYVEAEGDFDGIFERVPCCTVEDEASDNQI